MEWTIEAVDCTDEIVSKIGKAIDSANLKAYEYDSACRSAMRFIEANRLFSVFCPAANVVFMIALPVLFCGHCVAAVGS